MKEYLSHYGVPYEERNAGENPDYESELSNMLGYVTYPVVVVGKQTVVGYDMEQLQNIVPRLY